MGAAGDKEIGIRITVDAQGAVTSFKQLDENLEAVTQQSKTAEGGFTRLEAALTGLNSAVQLAVTAYNGLRNAASFAFDALSRGDDIANLSANFERLAQSSGSVASELEGALKQATEGTISRFDLLATANKGLLLGLDPSVLVEFASVADKLGDAVGVSATEAFNTLTEAVGRNKLAALERLGISTDSIDVEKVYADAVGISSDKLSNQQKVAANAAVALALVQEKTSGLAETTRGAGENLAVIGNIISDVKDRFLEALSSNSALNQALASLSAAIATIDFTPLINGITKTINLFGGLGENLKATQAGFVALGIAERDFGFFVQAVQKNIADQINSGTQVNEAIKSQEVNILALIKAYGRFSSEAQQPVTKDLNILRQLLDEANSEVTKSAKSFASVNKPLTQYDDLLKKVKKSLGEYTKGASQSSKKNESFVEGISNVVSEIKELGRLLESGAIGGEQVSRGLADIESRALAAGTAFEDLARARDAAIKDSALSPGFQIDPNIDQKKLSKDFFTNLQEQASFQVALTLSSALVDGAKLLADGKIGKEEFAALGGTLGTLIGGAIGLGIGGPIGGAAGAAVGAATGSILGDLAVLLSDIFGGDTGATKARKQVDRFFSDLFDKDRLTLVINGELRAIEDLDFFGGEFGNPEAGFFDVLNSATDDVRRGFEDLGLAVTGIFDGFDEIGNNLASVFANNVGPSLNNLQILLKQAGLSAEELNDQIIRAFTNGELSAIQANQALVSIQQIMADGIPGAVGATNEALGNLFEAGARGGAAAIDALQDIAFEAQEAGLTSLQQAQQLAIQSGEFTAEQINAVFATLGAFGIDSIEALATATESQIIAILANLQAQGILEDTTASIADTAAAIEAIPANQEKRVTFIADVQYTDRASTPQGQAVLQSAGAPTRTREGFSDNV